MLNKIKNRIESIEFTSGGLLAFFLVYLFISSAFLVVDYSLFVKTPIVVFNYFFILGALLSTTLGINYKEDKLYFGLISIGLSLTTLMIWGLIINFIFPIFGILKPLASIPLVSSLYFLISLLGVFAYLKKQRNTYKFSLDFINKNLIFVLLPIFILLISVLGTGLLNNMGNNFLILFLYPVIGFFFIYFFLSKRIFSDSVYVSVLYFSALSLLFTYSLRGPNILGWDINEEFQVFSKTLENLRWSMDFYKGLDYNACVSITILPTIFRVLTSISDQYIFKFFYQVIFAILPVLVYAISKKYLNEKYAFAGAFLFMSQTWFYEQMPALIRQEIAFVLYATLILVLFKSKLSERLKYVSATVFSVGIVLSHYSTSYILVVIFGIIFSVNFIIGKMEGKRVNWIVGYSLMVITVFLVIWQVFITNTGDAFNKFILLQERKGIEQIVIPTNVPVNEELVSNVSKKISENPTELNKVYFEIVKQYLIEQDSTKFNNLEASEYLPNPRLDTVYSNSLFPNYVDSLIVYLGKFLKLFILIILPAYGLYFSIRNHIKVNKFENIEFLVLNTVGLGLLLLMAGIPFLQIHYNITRLFLQAFITLSIFSIIGLKIFTDKLKVQKILMSCAILFVFLFQTGFMGHFSGGYKRITIDTIPSDFYTYYINDSEKSSAKWLGNIIQKDDLVQADNVSNLRLQSFGNTNAYNTKIFPLSIRKGAFVYLTKLNFVDRIAVLQYNNLSFVYEYPVNYISSKKNLIYSNGDSVIYK